MILALLIAVHPKLSTAEQLYDDYQYAAAVTAFAKALADPTFVDGPSRQRARLLLAFSYVWLKKEADAKRELRALFVENADYPIERADHHPSLMALYDRELAAYLVPAKPIAVKRTPTLGDRQPWIRAIPGGVGHFANRDNVTGGVFLGLELALVATNVAASVLWYRLRTPTGEFRPGTNPVPLQVTMDATAIAAITTAVVEIIDAFVWSPRR